MHVNFTTMSHMLVFVNKLPLQPVMLGIDGATHPSYGFDIVSSGVVNITDCSKQHSHNTTTLN